MNIESRPKQRVNPVLPQFEPLHGEKLLIQSFVERTGQKRTVRQTEGNSAAVHPDTGRAVRTAGGWNAKMQQRIRNTAERRAGARRDLWGIHPFATGQTDKIRIGNLREKFVKRRFPIQYVAEL